MVDSDHDDATTPRKRSSYRIAQLKDFLPLGHDLPSPLATRGQHLQGLIQSRSNSNLAGLRTNRWSRANSIAPPPESQGRRRSAGSDELHDPEFFRTPLSQQVSHLSTTAWPVYDDHERRMSHAASVLMGPEMRSQRLIGSTNPRYRWEQYWTPEEDLKKMRKPLRKYYERNNDLIQNYRYIDELLDSSLPHDLIQEYNTQVAQNVGYGSIQGRPALQAEADVPETISEEDDEEYHPRLYTERHGSFDSIMANGEFWANGDPPPPMQPKVKRTPRDIYRLKKDDSNGSDERQPLLTGGQDFAAGEINEDLESGKPMPPDLEIEDEAESDSPIVMRAIWINTIANFVLLILKIVVVVLSSSVSVLASLVDAALDFLSTAIVGLTTWMISRTDSYQYPIGRRRLEPVGVLVFSVIMITAFLQVFYEAFVKLTSGDREVVQLSPAAIAIMASTVVVKGLCWVWCRLIKNSSVQALAQDAMTDVVFNTFSIIFPLGKSPSLRTPSLQNKGLTACSRLLRQHLVSRSLGRCPSVTIRNC